MPTTSGGGGYSQKVGRNAGRGGSNINLKDFLPGGSKYAKKGRFIAGVSAGKQPEIGSKHQNIFQMVSRRYRIRCQQGLMFDCKPSK